MTTGEPAASQLVVALLLGSVEQLDGDAALSARVVVRDGVHVDISIRADGQTTLDYVRAVQGRYPDADIVLLGEGVVIPSSFVAGLQSVVRLFAARGVSWGVIGNSGITFPYFKSVSNLLIADGPADRFTGILPAAHLDPYVLLLHRDVKLSVDAVGADCPPNAPINDLATLIAWQAGKPCWICNLPVYVGGSYASTWAVGDSSAWALYVAARYNNATFASSFGTLTLPDHAADAKDFYYKQVEPVLDRTISHIDDVSVSVFVFATYYDADIFDRCLMSIVSQFERPAAMYLVGIDLLDDARRAQFCEIVDRYAKYLPIHWGEIDLPGRTPEDQVGHYLRDAPPRGYSLLLYDNDILFPLAVEQIRRFFRVTLGDTAVLPITTAETSRLHRSVETRVTHGPQVFFREIEKIGYSHEHHWLSSAPNALLHFTFPNAFLRSSGLFDLDFHDLGSCLPQRLLAEPLSFFLIERGAGYRSFQQPSPHQTLSPLTEGGTAHQLANKAYSLLSPRSNTLNYSLETDGVTIVVTPRDSAGRTRAQRARLVELETYHHRAEAELAEFMRLVAGRDAQLQTLREQSARELAELASHRAETERNLAELHAFSAQQERALNKFRSNWYFKTRNRLKRYRIRFKSHFR